MSEELSVSGAVTFAESGGLWGRLEQFVLGAVIWMAPERPEFVLHPMLGFPLGLSFDLLQLIRISKNTGSLVTLPDLWAGLPKLIIHGKLNFPAETARSSTGSTSRNPHGPAALTLYPPAS